MLLIGAAIYITTKLHHALPKKRDFLRKIICTGRGTADNPLEEVLDKDCSGYQLVNIKAIGKGDKDLLEISYYLNLKNENKSNLLANKLKASPGVYQVDIFPDEE